jgi:hypothetical protein
MTETVLPPPRAFGISTKQSDAGVYASGAHKVANVGLRRREGGARWVDALQNICKSPGSGFAT